MIQKRKFEYEKKFMHYQDSLSERWGKKRQTQLALLVERHTFVPHADHWENSFSE